MPGTQYLNENDESDVAKEQKNTNNQWRYNSPIAMRLVVVTQIGLECSFAYIEARAIGPQCYRIVRHVNIEVENVLTFSTKQNVPMLASCYQELLFCQRL